MAAEEGAAHGVTRIEARTGVQLPDMRELAASRDLMYLLAWRDVKVRYKQTVLGALWAVLQPVLTMVVFSLIFGRVGDVPSDGVPYPVFSLAGLVIWTYFSTGLIQSSTSLVNNLPLVTKVYFPRIVLPAAALLAGLVDFAISLVVLATVLAAYGVTPSVRILWAPVMIALAIVAGFGVSAGLGAMNVRYRDVRYVLPFLAQLWLFLTPVAYPASLLSEPWHTLIGINPMAGAVEGFRWSVAGTNSSPTGIVLVSVASSLLLLFLGLLYFVRAERSFADVA